MKNRNTSQLSAIIEQLQANEQALKAQGINHVSIFGSLARGEDAARSDVDVCIKLDEGARPRGFAFARHVQAISEHLKQMLNRPVDVVVAPVYKERLRQEIERDSVHAF